MPELLIRNASIIDGTGKPAFDGDIVVADGKIDRIGDAGSLQAEREFDASGRVVCPGFIDIHSHSDFTLIANRNVESGIRQGITTVVTGNCGHGPAPAPCKDLAKGNTLGFNANWGLDFTWDSFEEYVDTLLTPGIAMNAAPLVPHGTVRLAVMGVAERAPTRNELASMRSLVSEAMAAGAAGLSSGLEYSPGQYADEDELVALAEVAASHGRIYASHIRDRGDHFAAAVAEAISVARKAGLPAQLSHLAPRPYAPDGSFDRVLEMIYHARDTEALSIGIDTFPDPWGPAPLASLLPARVCEGASDEVVARLQLPATVESCRPYVEAQRNYLLRLGGPEKFYLTCSRNHPELVEKSFAEIGAHFGLDFTATIIRLLADDGEDFYNVMIRHIYAKEADLDRLLQQPICSLESDGAYGASYGHLKDFVMNRSSYCFTVRFLKEFVQRKALFNLEEGIRKMTSLPADCARLHDRGRLQPSKAADIVVLDVAGLADRATDAKPQSSPAGIELVLVNGEVVLENGRHTDRLPGQILPR
jgi:N-acyl-D-amino-acid deacylase